METGRAGMEGRMKRESRKKIKTKRINGKKNEKRK